MGKRRIKCIILLLLIMMFVCISPTVSATTVNVLDGQISVSDTGNKCTANGDGVQITVTASAGGLNFLGSTATNTITIQNLSGSKAEIGFNFSVVNQESCTFTSTGTTDGNRHTVVLENEGKVSITLKVKAGRGTTKTATLDLSGFAISKFSNEQVTVSVSSWDSSLGVATVNNGSSATVTSGETVTLKATPNGSTFWGWINAADNSVVSRQASYSYTVAETISLKAVFIGTNSPVWFSVGNTTAATTQNAYAGLDKDAVLGGEYDDAYTYYTVAPAYMYDNLTDALSKADSSGYKGVVPMNNGTISGDYTIPAGVTLLIPFDAAHTMYTTVPGFIYTDNKGVENLYRSLTLADGTNITVNGAISVSTNAHSADGAETAGYPCGDYSKLVMQAGSTITMNSGSALYAWGFITGDSNGSGTITVKNGATVYESFQMAGHRGGNQSTQMKNKVFPISQYYVHNVEVPMTMEYGSVGMCNTYINVSSALYKDTQVPLTFVKSSEALFNLTRGSVTKSYDGTKDRWTLEINGDVTVSPITLSFGNDGSINSKSYVLGINNNLTIEINSGTVTVGQDIAFQPGSELVVGANGKCILGQGVTVYVYDGDTWGNFCFNGGDVPFIPVPFSPTRTHNRTAADLVDAKIQVDGEVDTSNGYFYTTTGGANIFSTGSGVVKMNTCNDTTTYQLSQAASTYANIAATSAKLTNNNGDLVNTEAGTYKYSVDHGKWGLADASGDAHRVSSVVTTPPTCDSQGSENLTCNCGYSNSNELPTLEHEYDSVVTEPTCTTGGYTTHTCANCGNSYTSDEVGATGEHSFTDGVCACGTFKIYASSLRAGDTLDLFFYMMQSHLPDLDTTKEGYNYRAEITRYQAGSEDGKAEEPIPSSEWTTYGSDFYRFCYDGIFAKEMTDKLVITITKKVAEDTWVPASVSVTESVEGYAYRYLSTALKDVDPDSKDAKLRQTLVDMLQYGAACQTYFSHNTGNLANAQISEYIVDRAVAPENKYSGVSPFLGDSVTVENNLTYNVFLEASTEGKTVKVSYTDHYGTERELTRTVAYLFTDSAGTKYYGFSVPNLAIADGRVKITCQLMEGENVSATLNGSLENYCYRAINSAESSDALKVVGQMLMNFIDSAYRYFHYGESNT